MEQIKKYFKSWTFPRLFQIILGGFMFASYLNNHESMYLVLGIVLCIQAVFNLGCFGGNCSVAPKSNEEPKIKTTKYESKD